MDQFTITLDRRTGTHRPRLFRCPSCGRRRFVRYYNTRTDEYLPEEYGRCNREESCGYWRKLPTEYYRDEYKATEVGSERYNRPRRRRWTKWKNRGWTGRKS